MNIKLIALSLALFSGLASADSVHTFNASSKVFGVENGEANVKSVPTVKNGKTYDYYAFTPKDANFSINVDGKVYQVASSRGVYAPAGCNYTFEVYQNAELQYGGCSKALDTPSTKLTLINKSNNPIYSAFDLGDDFFADSSVNAFSFEQGVAYTENNQFLQSLNVKPGDNIQSFGLFDAISGQYVACDHNVEFGGVKSFEYIFDQSTEQYVCRQK
ncbi:hypothetical protein [Vibrio sp. 10N.261.46.A3]|uniref:hypothetical protein n=1 Tax=Vibrio sp. 10N.261.46.A3 TaxID=3229658 RepID=UPI003553A5D9